MRIFLRQVLPAGPAPQNPENPFQHATILDPRTATLPVLARLGKQGSNVLPLHFRQQRTRPGHQPSFGAADFVYLSSEKTQLPSFQGPVLGYATASTLFVEVHPMLQPEAHGEMQVFFVRKWFRANGRVMLIAGLGETEQPVFRVFRTMAALNLVGDTERVN
jgi:hypothetical protein